MYAWVVAMETSTSILENGNEQIMELPHDPPIPLLDKYPKEMSSALSVSSLHSMFTSSLLTTAKIWRIHQWMNERRTVLHTPKYTYTLEC